MSFLLRYICFISLVSSFLNTFVSPTQHLCHPDERDALLQFQTESFIDPDVSTNLNKEIWVNNSDCCSWIGITCAAKSGKVIGLDLCFVFAHGQLESNTSLFRLHHLRDLNLSSNHLSGEFPSSLLLLPNLESISLGGNPNLRGNLPDFRQNNSLVKLRLHNTAFSGTIPDSISRLKHLTILILFSCKFSGKIPFSLGNLSQLSVLDLSSNNLVGEIPSSFGNLNQLTYFDVGDNNLSGNLLPAILNFTQLRTLYLSSNPFIGSLPLDLNVFSPLKQLQVLVIWDIPLSTANITSDSDLLSHLDTLYLGGCNITEFPEFIRYRRNLVELDLPDNKIKGQVPDWLWRLPKLLSVDLSNNSLSGFNGSLEASPETQLTTLDLRSNAFQGPLFIPSKSLIYFLCSKNNFTGEIPQSICGLSFLVLLDLSDNNLHGLIPQCFTEILMSSLSELNLRNNSLSGNLPEIFMNAKYLMSLDVSHNRMEGELPASLTGCSALKVLNVGSNRINDMFPFHLNSLQKLQVLVLRSNKFHGSLHNADGVWFGFPQLKIIDVACNDFLGTLPSDYFLNWTVMSFKRDNNMEPTYIRISTYYTSLVLMSKGVSMEMERILTIYTAIDFSGNQLHGQIPDSIGLLKGLHSLNMSSNAFTGHIPSSLANLTNLESLDLSQNKISGEIPSEIGTLSSLEVINFSHNQLVGSIPQGTQFKRQNCSVYEGNPGLYGLSLKDVCGDIKALTPPQPELLETKEEELLSWIAAGLGFAPGVVFGLTMGYIVALYKHEWFIKTFGRSKQ